MLWRILVSPSSMAGAGAEFQVLVAAGLAELAAARIGKIYIPFIVSCALLMLLKLRAGRSSRLCELNLRVANNERSVLGCALFPLYQLPAFYTVFTGQGRTKWSAGRCLTSATAAAQPFAFTSAAQHTTFGAAYMENPVGGYWTMMA